MNEAEKIVSKEKVPSKLQTAADEVERVQSDSFVFLDEFPDQFPSDHKPHSYRYEELSDGSVVALWSNTRDCKVKLKAFDDIGAASAWSPREEVT